MRSKCFFCENKDVFDIAEGPRVPQDVPNVANFEFFEPGAHVASIADAHKITAASDIETSQIAFKGLYAIGEHTLTPTKHPPGHAATHSNRDPHNFRFEKSSYDLMRSGRLLEPDAIGNSGEEICILDVR